MSDAESRAQEVFTDWLRHPETERVKKIAQAKIDDGMQRLLSAGIMSSDPTVRALASSIRTYQAFVRNLSPKQEKTDDDSDDGENG